MRPKTVNLKEIKELTQANAREEPWVLKPEEGRETAHVFLSRGAVVFRLA